MQKNTEQRKKRKGKRRRPPHSTPGPTGPTPGPAGLATSPPRPLPCSPDRGRNRGRPRRTTSPATGRIRAPAPPASSGPSPTRPRSHSRPLRLPRQIHLPLPFDPHRPTRPPPFPSFSRPPCPNRHFAVSYAVAALDYTTSTSPLELRATATASPSSSSTSNAGDPLLPRRRPAAPKLSPASVCRAVSLSPLLPCPFSLARPLATSPRAPERRAAELAAGGSPVTKWSRA